LWPSDPHHQAQTARPRISRSFAFRPHGRYASQPITKGKSCWAFCPTLWDTAGKLYSGQSIDDAYMKQKWLILALVLGGACLLAVLGCRSVPKSASDIPSEKVSQGTPEPGPGLLATVDVSGSTNSSPYSIRIFTDGSATMSIKGGSSKNLKSGSVDAKRLRTLLQNVGDVSQLTSSQPCMKSVSFGTVTLITYNGKTSQDISCAGTHWPQAGYDLHDFIDRIKVSLPVPKPGMRSPQ